MLVLWRMMHGRFQWAHPITLLHFKFSNTRVYKICKICSQILSKCYRTDPFWLWIKSCIGYSEMINRVTICCRSDFSVPLDFPYVIPLRNIKSSSGINTLRTLVSKRIPNSLYNSLTNDLWTNLDFAVVLGYINNICVVSVCRLNNASQIRYLKSLPRDK